MSTADHTAKSLVPATVGAAEPATTVVDAAGPARGKYSARPVAGAAPTKRTAVPARLKAAASQVVPRMQYRIARLGVVGQAGLAALAAAAVLTLSAVLPAQRALETLTTDLARARQSPVSATVGPGTPQLLATLPTRTEMPAVIGQVFTEAKAAGVSLDTGHYTYTAAKGGVIAHYELEFPVKASYPDIRSFIDRTLVAVPSAALGKLRLERKAVGDGVVAANVVFVVFVRGGEQP
ncbi:MAG TPA: hypothetical protein VF764_07540 [Steroidobacteraceae bacterium]